MICNKDSLIRPAVPLPFRRSLTPLQHLSQPQIRRSDSLTCSCFPVAQIAFSPFHTQLVVLKISIHFSLLLPIPFLSLKAYVATRIWSPRLLCQGPSQSGFELILSCYPGPNIYSSPLCYRHWQQRSWSLVSNF